MGFLNAAMLIGLIAASIPLIIHLLNRRRYRTIDWGAMRFLKMSVVTRHRRLRIEELILLLLRTALLVALVMALARPLLKGLGDAGSRKDLVIVLDGSMSMSLKEGSGASLFDRAKEAARGAVGTLRPGDSVGVILGTRTPRPILPDLSYDFEKADKAIGRAHETLSSFDALKALDRALAMLRRGGNASPEILIITDGQSHGWFTTDSGRWRYVAEQLAAFPRGPVRITVLTLERRGAVSNLALGEVQLRRAVVGTDRDVTITVTVRNTGDVGVQPRRLSFAVDGKGPRVTGVDSLGTGMSLPVSSSHRFTTSGSHYVVADVESDMLPLDDRTWFGLEVLDSLPVLLVDGAAAPDPLGRATIFLEKALEPTPQYVVRPTVISPATLGATDLSRYRAVALCDVPQLSDADVSKLEEFVQSGGGLLVAPGARVKPQDYNAALYRGGEGLLPAEMLAAEGDLAARDKPFTLHLTGLTHETMRLLFDPEKSDLHEARIWRYFKLAAPTGTSSSAVVLRLANGDPFIVEKDLGRGRVLMAAAPLDASWSNLFMRTSFVVLAHEMIYYLSSPLIPARNVPAGEPLIVPLDEAAPAVEVEVTMPMGGVRTLPVERREGRRVAVLADTTEGGLYEALYRGRAGDVREYYVVNVESEESDLALLSTSARADLAARSKMVFFSDWSRVEASLKAGHDTREFWRWLAVLTVVMLLVEVALTRLFSKRRAAEVQGVAFGVNA